MKINKHLILAIAAGAGVVSSVVLAFQAGRKCDEILDQMDAEGASFIKKAGVVAKESAPAFIAVLLTAGALVAEFTGREKEFNKLTKAAENFKNKKERLQKDFTKYRDSIVELEGKETDIKAIQKSAEPDDLILDGDGEFDIKRHFKLDWLGDEETIEFDASLMDVTNGMATLNRILIDENYKNNTGCMPIGDDGIPVVSDFLAAIGQSELRTKNTDDAGWCNWVMYDEYGCSWIGYSINRVVGSDGVYWEIDIDQYPNYDIVTACHEYEATH